MYTALLNNGVPKNWEAAAYPSLKPLASWVKDFHVQHSSRTRYYRFLAASCADRCARMVARRFHPRFVCWHLTLQARIAFMRDWLVNGQPRVFWMSGFFFPQVHAQLPLHLCDRPIARANRVVLLVHTLGVHLALHSRASQPARCRITPESTPWPSTHSPSASPCWIGARIADECSGHFL